MVDIQFVQLKIFFTFFLLFNNNCLSYNLIGSSDVSFNWRNITAQPSEGEESKFNKMTIQKKWIPLTSFKFSQFVMCTMQMKILADMTLIVVKYF